ncbi:N,N'-diacetylchitobiose phosphorylase [Pillotina sp. SPG140]|jgi:cellobiose phosphorylase
MKYGYFDQAAREYVITRPDTPAPWANYVGSPEYGAIITNNAGGYSFVKSAAEGRIIRYRFNADDTPGRYIYLREDETNDFWSLSWQPVGRESAQYLCRHGTGYTILESTYNDIHAQAVFYVPHGHSHEVWALTVHNRGETSRRISIFGYAEFTNDSNYEQDQVNLQYSQFISRTYFKKQYILQTINEHCSNAVNGNAKASRFFGLSGAPVHSYCGDKQAFLGLYNGYGKPQAVQDGLCSNILNYNLNACGALHSILELEAGESKTVIFLLGEKDSQQADALISRYEQPDTVDQEVAYLKQYWHGMLDNFTVTTPDEQFNSMVNTWNAYQCFTTFAWSRAASLIYCGHRNGYGYRDTVQDIQGIIHLAPALAGERLRFMLSAQVHHGGALPLVTFDHKAGQEDTPDDESYGRATGHFSYRADDALWLFPTVYKYLGETGDSAFLDEVIPYADEGSGTVYQHLMKALDFSLNHLGIHRLPAGLHADWNDCLRLGPKGVSTFVAFQLYYALSISRYCAQIKNDSLTDGVLAQRQEELAGVIEKKCSESDRFIRGFTESGEVVGSKTNQEASLWLNPQTWAVISGFAQAKRAETVLNTVYEQLNTPFGARLMDTAFKQYPFDGALALLFNPGTKENAGVFLQTQGWLILAEALLGHGERAFNYYQASCPAAQNDKAEIRVMEPYVYGQFTESTESPFAGRTHVPWLTGTAATVMVACVEGILGIRPDINGLMLKPAIPAAWKQVTIEKTFRGKKLHINILNGTHAQSSLTVNGAVLEGAYIPAALLTADNTINLEL